MPVLLLELKRGLNAVCVKGVYDALHAVAHQVAGARVELNIVGIGYLLNKY